MPATAAEVISAVTTWLSASIAETSREPFSSVSTARVPSPQSATGCAGPPPPVKVWPVLTAPGLSSAGPVQVKSPYVAPEPVSCSDWPDGVVAPSATPMSVLVCPFATPLVPVRAPS